MADAGPAQKDSVKRPREEDDEQQPNDVKLKRRVKCLSHFAKTDVVVHCGEKTWEVHGVLLVMGCKWFFHALLRASREDDYKHVHIEEFDQDIVCWLIERIYGSGSNGWRRLLNTRPVTQLCMDIFDMGVYFDLGDQRIAAKNAYQDHMFALMSTFQANAPNTQVDPTELFNNVRDIYDDAGRDASKAFRDLVVGAVHSVRFGIKTDALIALVNEIPEFAVDLMKITLQRDFSWPYAGFCARCGAQRNGLVVFTRVYLANGPPVCICYKCQEQVGRV